MLKTDENGAPLAGCTFQITYAGIEKPREATTDGNGEAVFPELPLNIDVTVKETAAPEGYQLLPSKVINTGSKGGTVEYTFANSDDHVFKVHKTSSADNRNLMGAKFEVKGIDNDFINTYTTDALGEFTIQGRDLPNGSFEVYEIAAPEGYVTDGSDIQTFSWDNTRDITLSFKNAPLPGIQIYKYDKDSKVPLAGATFEIRRDGQVLQTVKTDVNGYAKVYNLPKGFYQVVEVEPPQGYLKDEVEHEVYIDPSADPTQIVREVNVPNTKKLSIRIIKQDKDTKVPLQGWKFDVFYNDAKLTSVTTNQDGEAMIENLQPGTYRIVEVDGDKEHYNLDAPEQTIELVKDQAEIPTLIFHNTIKKHFGIYKIDEETREPIQIFVDEIHVVMRRTAAAAVLCNGLALKRTFNDLAAVADVCREYRAVQVTPQPFLALTFAVGVLEAGNKTSEQVQAGVQLLTRDLNLLLQLIQAVKRIRVNLNRNNDLIRCDQRIDDTDIDIRRIVDQTVIILVCYPSQGSAQTGLLRPAAIHHYLFICRQKHHVGRYYVNVRIACMPDHTRQVDVSIQHNISDAFMVVAMYAECLAEIALLVVVDNQHALSVFFRQDVRHTDCCERLCDAALQVNDRYSFHFVIPSINDGPVAK